MGGAALSDSDPDVGVVSCACALRPEAQRWKAGSPAGYSGGPGMEGAGPVLSVLGLLLVSALFGVLGERSSADLGAHPGTSESCWWEAGTAW